jgi:TetR/AcrR family transcriptional repressor of nem operon
MPAIARAQLPIIERMKTARRLSPPGKPRGRPREFDIDTALDGSIRVFRERGFHATSIVDLSQAMELAAGSVYKAFRDKTALFLAAFDREQARRRKELRRTIDAVNSGRDRIHAVLRFYVDASYGAEGKRGCLLVGAAAEMSTLDAAVARRVNDSLNSMRSLLADLIAEGQADGSIAMEINRHATASLIVCVLQGMRVVGKTGQSHAEMTAIADQAMHVLD